MREQAGTAPEYDHYASVIEVRTLDRSEWRLYRQARLAALQDAPEAFVARHEDEAAYDDDFWRQAMTRSRRIVAERGESIVGLVCLGLHNDDPEIGEVFGLWTSPPVRGEHVAWTLLSTAAAKATEDGCRVLYFWAGADNVPALGLASHFGFRPTAERRAVRVAEGVAEKEADEVALELPLSPDPTQAPNPYMAFHS